MRPEKPTPVSQLVWHNSNRLKLLLFVSVPFYENHFISIHVQLPFGKIKATRKKEIEVV
jgi:hypothetical protein